MDDKKTYGVHHTTYYELTESYYIEAHSEEEAELIAADLSLESQLDPTELVEKIEESAGEMGAHIEEEDGELTELPPHIQEKIDNGEYEDRVQGYNTFREQIRNATGLHGKDLTELLNVLPTHTVTGKPITESTVSMRMLKKLFKYNHREEASDCVG